MLKNVAFICAALIIAAGAFSTNAQAQRHAGAHVGGVHGAHISGVRVGGGGHYYGRGYRGYARGYRGGYGGPYYGGGYYYGDDWALGAFAAGAILGGALAAQPYYGGDAVGYCMQRFRSYDPGSGTYLGNDGYRHPCP
jgi:hypothetical protein